MRSQADVRGAQYRAVTGATRGKNGERIPLTLRAGYTGSTAIFDRSKEAG